MNKESVQFENEHRDLRLFRKLMSFAGYAYFFWWFAAQIVLPHDFNPFLSRFVIASFIFAMLMSTYISARARTRARARCRIN